MAPTPSRADLLHLRTVLRRAGLRATPSRVAVLAFLREAERPVSHPDLVEAFASRPWDRTTLYRNLLDLEQAGLARRTELGDRLWRFEDVGTLHASSEHPHFICTECGQVACLPGLQVSLDLAGGEPRAVGDRQVEVQLRGLCDGCR